MPRDTGRALHMSSDAVQHITRAHEYEREVEVALRRVPALAARLDAAPARGGHRTRIEYVLALREIVSGSDLPFSRREVLHLRHLLEQSDSAYWFAAQTVEGLARTQVRMRVRGPWSEKAEDIFQDAMLGAYEGARRFDPKAGTKFTTYAAFWIRVAIQRTLNPSEAVDVSQWMRARVARVYNHGIEDEDARLATVALTGTLGLDQPLGTGVSLTPLDTIVVEPEVDDALDALRRAEKLEIVLQQLSPKERRVIAERFGLSGRDERLAREIGVDLGVSHQRVRQIESSALRKLRLLLGAPSEVKPLPLQEKPNDPATSSRSLDVREQILQSLRAQGPQTAMGLWCRVPDAKTTKYVLQVLKGLVAEGKVRVVGREQRRHRVVDRFGLITGT